MDYLRAGYSAPARWRRDGDDTILIRWYRAAPGAKVYTEPHAFGSTVWDVPDDIADHGPGEVPNVRAWNPTIPPVPPGTEPVYSEDYLLHGCPDDFAGIPCQDARLAMRASYLVGPAIRVYQADLAFNATWERPTWHAFLALNCTYTTTPATYAAALAFNASYDTAPLTYAAALAFDCEYTGPGGVITAVCPSNPIPVTLTCTFDFTAACPAIDSRVVTLNYDVGRSLWAGTFTYSGVTYEVQMADGGGGFFILNVYDVSGPTLAWAMYSIDLLVCSPFATGMGVQGQAAGPCVAIVNHASIVP